MSGRREGRPPRLGAPEVLFLVAGLLAGGAYLTLFPPLSIADEPLHFYRAAGLAAGEVVPERRGNVVGATIPTSLLRLEAELGVGERLPSEPQRRLAPAAIRAALDWPLAPRERSWVDLRGTAMYPLVAHLFPALGVAAGALVEASPLALVYLGRLANLLASTGLTWLAIRWAPFGRWPLALLALTPMAVSTRGSLSADAVTTALGFVLLSLVARLAWADEPSDRERWLLLPIAAALCLTKLPYVALLLAIAVVPRERLALRRRWRFWLSLAVVVGLAIAATSWSAGRVRVSLRPGEGAEPDRQARAMVTEPSRFVGAMVADYATHADRYLAQAVGVQLGWLDVQLPVVLVGAYGAAVLVLLVLANGLSPPRVTPWQRVVATATIAAVAVLVSASQYVVWTPYLGEQVEGVQGRYFHPAAPLVVWLLAGGARRRVPPRWLGGLLAAGYAVVTVVACCYVVQRYYG